MHHTAPGRCMHVPSRAHGTEHRKQGLQVPDRRRSAFQVEVNEPFLERRATRRGHASASAGACASATCC